MAHLRPPSNLPPVGVTLFYLNPGKNQTWEHAREEVFVTAAPTAPQRPGGVALTRLVGQDRYRVVQNQT